MSYTAKVTFRERGRGGETRTVETTVENWNGETASEAFEDTAEMRARMDAGLSLVEWLPVNVEVVR